MIEGIGVDIVSPQKIESAVKRWGDSFLERVFNSQELASLNNKGKIYYQRIAARFAAKEAVFKALSKKYNLALKDILITNLPNGAPICKFKNDLNLEVKVSISHIEEYAVAVALAVKKNYELERNSDQKKT
ncbi:MAG TPA: holo-[acyl-carrier-protein] synthase [Candidatus Omnitrophica bacterium]|nr:MAG: holo-[acyl-carrier-protein] synthase [Candidatus Omnitrophota bacterium]RKY43923.1 MAG: holo-[acyl-carrier-protein] synthase [Candidatus Omnitrophota bacterium]HEC69484.1 holo-[acyl-carrier-protein] synthase [Candidatus Omnitrophota bacterium]